MEELLLVLQFSVLVDPHSCVGGGGCYELQPGVYCDALNELFVAFKSLNLCEFIAFDGPHYGGSVHRSRNQEI